MPLIGIKNDIDRGGIHMIPYEGLPIQTQWNLIWLKKKKLSPATLAFKKYILGIQIKFLLNTLTGSLNIKLLILELRPRCSAFAKAKLIKISRNYNLSDKLPIKKETVKPLFYKWITLHLFPNNMQLGKILVQIHGLSFLIIV
jgi:hypothetical protein